MNKLSKRRPKKDRRPTISPPERVRLHGSKILERAKLVADRAPGSEPDIYDGLAGHGCPPKDGFGASCIEPRVKAGAVVAAGVIKRIKSDPLETAWAVDIRPNVSTPLTDMEFDVIELRKAKLDLKRAGIAHAIGGTKLYTRPAPIECQVECYPVICLIAYGPGLDHDSFVKARYRLEKRCGVGDEPAMKFRRLEREAIASVAAGLFDMADIRLDPSEAPKRWKKMLRLRDFRRFQALSMAPFKQMCFAIGDGDRLLEKVLVEGKHLLKPLWNAKEQVIHRDQIAQFIAAELVRLGLKTYRVPFIKVR